MDNLRQLRKAQHKTQAQMGELLGISQQAYATYENNVSNPPLDVTLKLASFFGVSVDFLLGRAQQGNSRKVLTMDIGNTNVKIGVFDGDNLVASWRVSTMVSRTADEYGMVLFDLLHQCGATFDDIEAIVISSVAPALNYTIEHMCKYYMHKTPIIVNGKLDTGIEINYDNKEELGSDRIVVSSASYHFYGGPLIVVDFGTATTFNLVSKDGKYLGGAIAPGIKTAMDALVSSTAKLPPVELAKPQNIIGTNTKGCMQSGIVFGYTGLVKYMLTEYKKLDGMQDAKVIATGGLSELVKTVEPQLIDVTDRALALKGLKAIYDLQRNKTK